jgi:hypothetical protein
MLGGANPATRRSMLASEQVDELICMVAEWDRDTLTSEFMSFDSRFPLDFTPEYLSGLSVEALRHIFLAICMQNQKMPTTAMAAA